MKRINQFDALPEQDQEFIRELCARHTYDEVARIIEQPSPEGLGIKTSDTSLCRWYTRRNAEAACTRALGQLSKAIQVRHQSDASGHMQALLALVQNRLLESLTCGKALADLTSEFRILFHLHKTFLADHKWRADSGASVVEADYDEFLKSTCDLPHLDFIREGEDPKKLGLAADEASSLLCRFTNEQMRSMAVQSLRDREDQALREVSHRRSAATSQRDVNNVTPPAESPLVFPSVAEQFADLIPSDFAISPHETPVISHISPNFTSPQLAKSALSQEASAELARAFQNPEALSATLQLGAAKGKK